MSKQVLDFDDKFTEKYKLYGEMLYKIAFLYTKNSADTEDILQDIFIKYFSLKKTFSSPEHEKAWFIRITQNKAIDYIRKSHLRDYELNTALEKEQISSDSDTTELKEELFKKLLCLDNKYKTVVVLYYYYDYSTEEIAKTMKISVAAVKKRLQRAREKLKKEMEEYTND